MINTPDLIIFFRLMLAHIMADFFLQRYHWVVDKREGVHSPYLYYHVAIVGSLTYLLLGDISNWQVPLFIMVVHFFVDWWKSTRANSLRYFVIDQLLHIATLVIGWVWYMNLPSEELFKLWKSLNTKELWIIASGYALMLRPFGFLIGKLTEGFKAELDQKSCPLPGLQDAGSWIGYIERTIIFTLILFGQYSAIGFLIAAKSILRYSGKTKTKQQHLHAEYVLIGTLMSFLLAIITGVTALYFLQH